MRNSAQMLTTCGVVSTRIILCLLENPDELINVVFYTDILCT